MNESCTTYSTVTKNTTSRVHSLQLSSKTKATYRWPGFASDTLEEILGAGHAQQEISQSFTI